MEDLFDEGGNPDSESCGTNRTGHYLVKIKLNKDIPQLLPFLGDVGENFLQKNSEALSYLVWPSHETSVALRKTVSE